MPKNPIVGSLSPQRLQAMLEIAAPAHPQLDFEIKALGAPAGVMPPLLVGTQFKGERPTARSGEAWNAQTVARALGEVSREVASSKAGEDDLVTVRNLEPSLAQAVLTDVALEKGWAVETADGRVEWVQFGKIDAGWIEAVVERIKALFTGREDRPNLPETPDPLPNKCRLVVVGDWGTGLYGAPRFTQWRRPRRIGRPSSTWAIPTTQARSAKSGSAWIGVGRRCHPIAPRH